MTGLGESSEWGGRGETRVGWACLRVGPVLAAPMTILGGWAGLNEEIATMIELGLSASRR